jgi:hypothetical protein
MMTMKVAAALAIALAGCATAPPNTSRVDIDAKYAQAEPPSPAVAETAPVRQSALLAAPVAPAPAPFRPAACDWDVTRQGVGAC